MQPAQGDLALRRNAPTIVEWSFADEAGLPFDFTGWDARLQIRLYPGQPGDALATLTRVSDGQGVFLIPDRRDSIRVTVDQSTAANLPASREAGDSVTLSYDLVMIDPTGFRQVFREGAITVQPGVTL